MDEQKLRVVWICLEWPSESGHSGGVARYAYRIASQIASIVSLTVITQEGGLPIAGVRMRYLRRSKGRIDRFYRHPLRLRSMVRDERVDVVHAFGDDWALYRVDALLVRTFLGSSMSEARSSSGLRRWNHYLLSLLEHRSQSRADVRIAIGPESAKEFDCSVIMAPVVPIPTPRMEKSVTPSVVFVGSFEGRKRGAWVQRAVRELRSRSGADVRLTVFGPASDAKNWDADVQHIAGATDSQVQEAIARSWVLAAPSQYEGFGIPSFEALALGTRVVATRNPGSQFQAELVNDHAVFDLVETEDEFAEALARSMVGGGILSDEQVEAVSTMTGSLLRTASGRFLVDQVYATRGEPVSV